MKHFGKGKIIEMVNKPAAARDSESGKLEKVRQEVFFYGSETILYDIVMMNTRN